MHVHQRQGYKHTGAKSWPLQVQVTLHILVHSCPHAALRSLLLPQRRNAVQARLVTAINNCVHASLEMQYRLFQHSLLQACIGKLHGEAVAYGANLLYMWHTAMAPIASRAPEFLCQPL